MRGSLALVFLGAVGCTRPLAPGETRCHLASGRCETAPAVSTPPPPQAPSTPQCQLATPTAPLKTVTQLLPDGFSEQEAFEAALQFLTTSGTNIDSSDPQAHTIISKPVTGQTIQSSCEINEYRSYTLRIVIAGKNMIVTMDCYKSYGWEPHMSANGQWMPAHRDAIAKCALADPVPYTSALDATLQMQIIEGTIALMQLRHPERLQPQR